MGGALKYKICGFALQGTGHIKNSIPCQDKISFFQNDKISVVALSDGAGSAKYSHFGAQSSVEYICEEMLKNFDKYFNQVDGLFVKIEIIDLIKEKISELALRYECNIADLAHTLLFVAIKENNFILFHIGDGVIGYTKNNNIYLASAPCNGEFANETVFATSNNACQYAKIIKGNMDNLDSFVLMSDGTSESFYDKKSKNLIKIVHKILVLNSIVPSNALKKELENNFKKNILTKTTDDCSLLMISKYRQIKDLSLKELSLIFNTTHEKTIQKSIDLLKFLQQKKTLSEIVKFMHIRSSVCKKILTFLETSLLVERQNNFYIALII